MKKNNIRTQFCILIIFGCVAIAPNLLAQSAGRAVAAEADPYYYGNLKEESVSQMLSRFNAKYETEAKYNAQTKLTESELKGAFTLALEKLNGHQRTVVERIFKLGIVPVGTKLTLQTVCNELLNDRPVTVHLWKIEMELGIKVPDDPTLEKIATPEEMAQRWLIPIRLAILKIE